MADSLTIQRALISVSDKSGLTELARALTEGGAEIYSTGGTRRHLQDQGIDVLEVAAYTGFPEMMDGRLKTLHPKVFGGILGRRDREDDLASMAEHGIVPFDLVVVNLYPFETTVSRAGVTLEEAIEQIDIGGPSLVRAAAKNHAFVTIATDPNQYAEILSEFRDQKTTSLATRRRLAGEAFAHTAGYDRAIANFFAGRESDSMFPETIQLAYRRQSVLRYGENPHQQAAVYRESNPQGANIVSARQLNGKELSYNNLLDLDSALSMVRSLPTAGAVVLKHNNPCGAAVGDTLAEAAQAAMDGDPLSAYGSVLGFNQVVDGATAEVLAAPGLFIEAIVAPDFEAAALEILTTRPKWKKNVRLMQVGEIGDHPSEIHHRPVSGGILLQQADVIADTDDEWETVTEAKPGPDQARDLDFAWRMVRHVKSNAIVLCKNRTLLGAGAGQMSRVDSVDIAIAKAGDRAHGSVLGSDAFFPFPDSIHKAADAGVAALIQPGGSRRDQEVIDACNERGLPMIFTGRRHFRH